MAGNTASAETVPLSPHSTLEPPPVVPGESRAVQVDWYLRNGASGTQGFVAVYADIFGLSRETAMKIATGFSGGIAHSGESCSMIIGAVMLISLKHGSAHVSETSKKKATVEITKQFLKDFRERHKSIVCRELLQADILDITSSPERYAQAHEDGTFDECFRSAQTIVDLLENKYDILNRKKETQ